MPGHRSPDGTVMVRGGEPTHGEDDSKIAKVSKILCCYFKPDFLLNATYGRILCLVSDYNCLRLLLCHHHLPDQRLVLLQGVTKFSKGLSFNTTLHHVLSCRLSTNTRGWSSSDLVTAMMPLFAKCSLILIFKVGWSMAGLGVPDSSLSCPTLTPSEGWVAFLSDNVLQWWTFWLKKIADWVACWLLWHRWTTDNDQGVHRFKLTALFSSIS